ncbi:MAG TPA: nitroreductase family protein [Acidimicrobiia bacterium]|nr:nitroreductase family protein [Acidimicrobiia bacterium]
MELSEAIRTTAAVRDFTDQAVSDEEVYRLLDSARFAPSGGNRQGWRVVLVKDRALRRSLRDVYTRVWYEYVAQASAGLVPWAPITDRDAERRALARAPEIAVQAAAGPGGFAEHLDAVPVLLVVLADLRVLAATDRDGGRYTIVGGASVYPFAWSLLLAARDAGLGGVVTTMVTREEPEVRRLLSVPDEYAVAALVALGRPSDQPTRLRRAAVADFTTIDRFDGAPLGPAP